MRTPEHHSSPPKSRAVVTLAGSRNPLEGILRELDATISGTEVAVTARLNRGLKAHYQALHRIIGAPQHLAIHVEPTGDAFISIASGAGTVTLDTRRPAGDVVHGTNARVTINGEPMPQGDFAHHARISIEMATSVFLTSRARKIRTNLIETGTASSAQIKTLMDAYPKITIEGLRESKGWEQEGRDFVMHAQGMTVRLAPRGHFRLFSRDCDTELTVSSICRDTEFFWGLFSSTLAFGWSKGIDNLYRELKEARRSVW